jgi:hypothetical protein
MKKLDFETGDRFLIKGNGFLAKGIQVFMEKYCRDNGITCDWIGNHAGSIVVEDDHIWIYEAVAEGYVRHDFSTEYAHKKGWITMRKKGGMTDKEKKRYANNARKLKVKVVSYQFWNFPQWMAYILSRGKIDLFGLGDDSFVYCFEGEERNCNASFPGHFPLPEMATWPDLYLDPLYEINIDTRK